MNSGTTTVNVAVIRKYLIILGSLSWLFSRLLGITINQSADNGIQSFK